MASSLRRFKPTKTWIVFGVALLIGLLAALAARSYLSSQMDAMEAQSRGNKVSVVVAKRELRRGERLSSENVAVRSIPSDFAHSNAVLPSDFDRLDGQPLAFPVKPGEMVLWSLMEGKRAPTFSARVDAGHRAITVPVDEINSISGLLEPGDTIDLMVTFDRKGKKTTLTLLQSVRVMATGQRSVDDPKSGERRQYSTVTLDTTPDQARNVILARDVGKLTALLRNPQDQGGAGAPAVDMASLLTPPAETGPVRPRVERERQVPVLYGGRGGKFPAEGLKLGQYVASSADAAAAAPVLAPPAVAPGPILITLPLPIAASNTAPPTAAAALTPPGHPLNPTALRQPQ